MKTFWPNRPTSKGFSVENLATKYSEKISGVSSNKNSNQFSYDSSVKSMKEDNKNKAISHLPIKTRHWANRDFSEYREVA